MMDWFAHVVSVAEKAWTLAFAAVLIGLAIWFGPVLIPKLADDLTPHRQWGTLLLIIGGSILITRVIAGVWDLAQRRFLEAAQRSAEKEQERARFQEGFDNLETLTPDEAVALVSIIESGQRRFPLPDNAYTLAQKGIIFIETVVHNGPSVFSLNPLIREKSAELLPHIEKEAFKARRYR
jgi:hypothetical protein